MTKKNLIRSAAVAAVVALTAMTSRAIPVNITVGSGGALLNTVGIANDSQYDTLIGGNGNSPSDNLAFLNALIGNWNGASLSPVLIPATLTGVLDSGLNTGNPFSFTGTGKFDYVVFHFGAGNAGGQQVSPGGWYQAFYLNGADISTLSFPVPTVGGQSVGGISSARFFGPRAVPDGGVTVLMLGSALAGLGVIARRFRK